MKSRWKRWEATELRWTRKVSYWTMDGKPAFGKRSDRITTTQYGPDKLLAEIARRMYGWASDLRPMRVRKP